MRLPEDQAELLRGAAVAASLMIGIGEDETLGIWCVDKTGAEDWWNPLRNASHREALLIRLPMSVKREDNGVWTASRFWENSEDAQVTVVERTKAEAVVRCAAKVAWWQLNKEEKMIARRKRLDSLA